MSSRRNNNETASGGTRLLIAAVVAIIALVIVVRSSDQSRQGPPHRMVTTARPPAAPVSTPVRNPIEEQLRPPDGVTRAEGVAVAIVMDTSGSMNDRVRDAGGGARPKIEIARRSALAVISKTAAFAKEHPEKRILMGVYEFSVRPGHPSARTVIPLMPPDPAAAQAAIARMTPNGGTPIGDAIIQAKRDLDRTGLSRLHILVVTDGENNHGYAPGDVVNVIAREPDEWRASVYFIAFDVAAAKFNTVREAGGLVLAAANEPELQQTLDYVLTGKILAEQPTPPKGP